MEKNDESVYSVEINRELAGGNLAVLMFQNPEEVLHHAAPFEDIADLLCDGILLGLGLLELLAEGIEWK